MTKPMTNAMYDSIKKFLIDEGVIEENYQNFYTINRETLIGTFRKSELAWCAISKACGIHKQEFSQLKGLLDGIIATLPRLDDARFNDLQKIKVCIEVTDLIVNGEKH